MSKQIEDLRGKPVADLKNLLEQTRDDLFKMRFAATTEPVDHPNKISDARRRVARINTILRQRELEAAKKAAPATAAAAGEKK